MKKAFTLIELLVVIAIIAILAAILFPVFAQAKNAAKKTNDLTQLKQLGTSTLIYSSDYDDLFMAIPAFQGDSVIPLPHWADRAQPYVKNRGIFADPSNNKALFADPKYLKPGQLSVTDLDKTHLYRVTYTWNHLITHADAGTGQAKGASQTSIPDVAGTILMGPSQNWYSWSQCRIENGVANMYWNVSGDNVEADFWGYSWWGGPKPLTGYAGGSNFSFADSHAKTLKMVPGGDAVAGTAGTLYKAFFAGGFTRANVNGTNVCPTGYDSESIGY